MVSDSETAAKRCFNKVVSIESKVCATGTAWGLLQDKPIAILALWWLVRHIVYFAISLYLLLEVDGSTNYFIAFFMLVHGYKLVRFLGESESETTQSKVEDVKEEVV
mmetsp:Transcript_10371/g.11908  ORF Transcript_10371/g.11908 Transcript_10371/m.11908 type:complete len:107 (+) Transcript_10371:96-416(+)